MDMRRRPRSLTSCNCSICRRYGAIWAYFTRKSVDYHSRPEAVAPYIWGDGAIEFYHCTLTPSGRRTDIRPFIRTIRGFYQLFTIAMGGMR